MSARIQTPVLEPWKCDRAGVIAFMQLRTGFPQPAATGHCSHRLSTTSGHRPSSRNKNQTHLAVLRKAGALHITASPSGHLADLLLACLLACSLARLLVCSLACLLAYLPMGDFVVLWNYDFHTVFRTTEVSTNSLRDFAMSLHGTSQVG